MLIFGSPQRLIDPTPQERENMIAVSMLKDPFTVDPDKWTPLHTKLIKRATSYPRLTASSCIQQLRRCCASRLAMTAHGCLRCDRGGTTTTTSMCALPVSQRQATVKVKSPEQRRWLWTGTHQLVRQAKKGGDCRGWQSPAVTSKPRKSLTMAKLPKNAALCLPLAASSRSLSMQRLCRLRSLARWRVKNLVLPLPSLTPQPLQH